MRPIAYIYLDDTLVDKRNMGNGQGILTVQDDTIKVGEHLFEAVQYAGDNTNGKVIPDKSAKFKISSQHSTSSYLC